MRFLAIHVDYFKCKITEKGRSKAFEEFQNPETTIDEGLVVLSSVEKQDERSPQRVAEKASEEIAQLVEQLKVETIVLHSFAHLFAELSNPRTAIEVMKFIEEKLKNKGLNVIRTPFGWFNTLEIKAKGHPISRVARIITPD